MTNENELEFLRIKRDQSRNLLEAAKRLKIDNDKIDQLFIAYCDSVEAYCLAASGFPTGCPEVKRQTY